MIPCRVTADLNKYLTEQEEAEKEFYANRDKLVEEEVYRLEKIFSTEDMLDAIAKSSGEHQVALLEALKKGEATETWAILCDIRDAWIKKQAEINVEKNS